MRNIKLIVEYDGTGYSGWQRQKNALTIQEVLEGALSKVTGEDVSVTGAGRTDSGVHARGQVANFFTNCTIPPDRFSFALNSVLPLDIRIKHSEEVPDDFHARYSAVGKRYKYSMIVHPHGTAIGRYYYHHIRHKLDIESMAEAAASIKGTHDFAAFQSSGGSVKSTVRTIYDAQFQWSDPYLYFIVEGNGFLYNMVRILVGTFIEIGTGRKDVMTIQQALDSGDRNLAGFTAPAQGLCLEEVHYDFFLDTVGDVY